MRGANRNEPFPNEFVEIKRDRGLTSLFSRRFLHKERCIVLLFLRFSSLALHSRSRKAFPVAEVVFAYLREY